MHTSLLSHRALPRLLPAATSPAVTRLAHSSCRHSQQCSSSAHQLLRRRHMLTASLSAWQLSTSKLTTQYTRTSAQTIVNGMAAPVPLRHVSLPAHQRPIRHSSLQRHQSSNAATPLKSEPTPSTATAGNASASTTNNTTSTSWETRTGNINENLSSVKSTFEHYKPQLRFYSNCLLAGTAVYVLYKGIMYIVDFFTSLNFLDVGEASFVAGAVCSLCVVGLAALAARAVRLRPEPVYSTVERRVLNSLTVRQLLGDGLKPGAFRAYSYLPPGIRYRAADRLALQNDLQQPSVKNSMSRITQWLLQWYQPKRMQLFFSIEGERDNGMVSAEVENWFKGSSRPRFILLAVDNLKTQQRVVLAGDPNYAIYQGIIKLR